MDATGPAVAMSGRAMHRTPGGSWGNRDSVVRNCKRESACRAAGRRDVLLQLLAVAVGGAGEAAVPASAANAFPQAGIGVLHEGYGNRKCVRRGDNVRCSTMHEVSRD